MPQLNFAVGPSGLIVDVLVGLAHMDMATLQARGMPLPRPAMVRGEIDTGSNVSSVSAQTLRMIGLSVPLLQTQTQAIGGSNSVSLFEVSLSIFNRHDPSAVSLVLPTLMVIELPQPLPDSDVLIGLDVLSMCRFHLDGPRQTSSMDF